MPYVTMGRKGVIRSKPSTKPGVMVRLARLVLPTKEEEA